MSTPWRIDEAASDGVIGQPPSMMATLTFLRAALRRRRRRWLAAGVVGLLLGVTYAVLVPPPSQAQVTLLLAFPPDSISADEMLTAQTLLRTRTVAEETLQALGSDETPEAFERTFTSVAPTTTVLQLVVSAPDDAAAIRTASTLAKTYLGFRAQRLRAQAQADVVGDEARIAELRRDVAALERKFDANSTGTPAQQAAAQDALSAASNAKDEISTLEQGVQTRLGVADSLIGQSMVLDPATTVPPPGKKRLVLMAVTGLIACLFLGAATVLFGALTSNRLRRREEVALAVGAPVRSAVRERGTRRRRWLPVGRSTGPVTTREGLEVLSRGLESAFEALGTTPARVVLATVDNEIEGAAVAGAAAVRLSATNRHVFVVDLSRQGGVDRAVSRARAHQDGPAEPPAVFRPRGVAQLARGPLAPVVGITSDLGENHPLRDGWDSAEHVLAVAPVDFDTGVEELATWAQAAVLLVTAGRSSAERLRTAAELLRRSGLEVLFVLMLGCDATDESLGQPEQAQPVVQRKASS